MTIWKFKVDPICNTIDDFPITHRILSVGEQDGDIMLWALVDPNGPAKTKQLTVLGTGWHGHFMDGIMEKRFIGTVQMQNGLVWHVFE